MSYLEKKLNSKKIFLFIAMAAVLFADLFVTVTLISFGLGFAQLAVPLVLTVLDIAFIAIAVFTNFRFTYSLKYVIGYSAAALALVMTFALINSGATGKSVVMSVAAAVLWAGVHLLFGAAFASSVMTASTAGGKAKLSSALLGALAIAGVIGYSGFVIGSGVFGQGYAEMQRTVVYEYDKDNDYYIATGALSGKSHELKVPASFNGKPVGAVDASLFATGGLSRIDLTGVVETLKYTNLTDIGEVIDCPEISLSKNAIDVFVKDMVAKDDSFAKGIAISVLDSLVPAGLSENEVYVTFSYTPEVFEAINGEVLPIWIGNKNEVFSLDFASHISYVEKSDKENEEILNELYTAQAYGGGQILSSLKTASGSPIVGTAITSSVKNVAVIFEPIYKFVYTLSNDGLYNTSINNVTEAPRYTTLEKAENVIGQFPPRAGFSLEFEYEGERTDISSAIEASFDREISITPVYTMLPPTLAPLAADKDKGIYTYGDAMLITGSAEAAISDFELTYAWYCKGMYLGSSSTVSDDLLNYDEDGIYEFFVTSSHKNSSLSSTESIGIEITVNKKPLPITFNALSEGLTKVYDGNTSYITISYDTESVVVNDVISYEISVESVKDAGEYKPVITLKSDTQYKYEPTVSSAVYTVYPKELEIVWTDDTEFIYNGELQHRGANIISGICGEDEVELIYAGFDKNAGEKTATITASNANYSVKSEDRERTFTVKKAPLTVEWNSSSLTMVYDGTATRKPTVSYISGICKDEKVTAQVRVTNPSKNVGTYQAGVTLDNTTVNANYYIESGEDVSFEITKKPVTVSWANTELTYNGVDNRLPTATVSGAVKSEDVGKTVTSNEPAKNVGNYTASVSISNTNYEISGEASVSFNIKKADVVILWGSTNLTYNGKEQAPTHSIKSGVVAGEKFNFEVAGKYKDASAQKRTAIVSLVGVDGSLPENYNITNPTFEYTIAQKAIVLYWSEMTKVYNGEMQTPKVTWTENIEGEDPELSITEFKDVGVHTALVTVNNSNYKLTSAVAGQCTFTITRAPLTVEWSENTYQYDGENHRPTPTIKSGVFGDDEVTLTVEGQEQKNFGSYMVKVKSNNGNYYVTSATESLTYTITAKPIRIQIINVSVTYNSKPQSASVTVVSGVIGNDDPKLSVPKYTSAGEYKSLKVEIGNKNYAFEDENEATFDFLIEKQGITVEWGETELTYAGRTQAPTPRVASGKYDNDTITLEVTGGKQYAGSSYTAEAVCKNANYKIISGATVQYSISPKEITIDYETDYVYNGKVQNPKYEIYGLADSSELGLSFESCGKNVGSYGVTASITNINYKLSEESKSFTMVITPRVLEVVIVDASLVYTGMPQTPDIRINKGVDGEDYKVTVQGSATEVGEGYTVTVQTANSNYKIEKTVLSFDITKATASVAWSGGNSYTEDGNAKAPSAACKGVANENITGTVKYFRQNGSSWVEIGSAPTGAGRYKAVFTPDTEYEKNYSVSGTEYEFTVKEASEK